MAINVLLLFITFVVLSHTDFLYAEGTDRVELINAPKGLKPIYHDPIRIDAFSAFIALTGGDVADWSFRRSGVYCFKKPLNPFLSMTVTEFSPSNRAPLFNRHFTYGGQVASVVSTADVSNMTFSAGVALLRLNANQLSRAMSITEFREDSTAGKLIISSALPLSGGWNLRLSVNQLSGFLRFALELVRDHSQRKSEMKVSDVNVEVEI